MMTRMTHAAAPGRRGVLGLAALAAGAVPFGGARAAGFPERPVRVLVGYAAGGPTDLYARRLAEGLGAALGLPVVVENRPGASGTVAGADVARARPDGYTLLVTASSAHAVYPQLVARPPYDPVADFAGIGVITVSPTVIAVHPSVPADSLAALLGMVRAAPGRYAYGTGGAGSVMQLGMELLLREAGGLRMEHIPYRGAGPAVQDCIAGHVPVVVDTFAPMLAHHRDGRLRILCVMSERRSAMAPEVPTAIEAGVPGAVANTYAAFLAPAGTPADVLARLNGAMRAVTQTDEFRAFLRGLSAEPVPDPAPAATMEFIRAEYDKWTPVIRALGLRIE